ncbi:MAG: topoisomerase DNA-binding C4 zinc finger domain-containing protein, partial [Deltaproteobacteria bacterium]|jgi:DNA topoisomerase-1|nr:topoisomerase DNA-binding C4 zinc finger domain-containing protein [Deltaproteobacteria bacterium]
VVYLGPDPDREGEAIAWHIAESLGRDKHDFKRVLLHELTPAAIKAALADPTDISLKRFESQQTRRILDRLMGYLISPVLWDKLKRGLSAGRVQSVALRLVVDRERQIFAFVPEEYWSLDAFFAKAGQPFRASLVRRDGKKIELRTAAETQACVDAVAGRPFTVRAVASKERRKNAPPPFTTSTMQQAAFSRLGISPARAMRLAQQLYEGVELPEGTTGLITYMRTDSVRVNDQAAREALDLASSLFGPGHAPAEPNRYRNRKGAQDAHEAIRPTSASRTPLSLSGQISNDHLRLYSLVWSRFVGSQMTPAVYLQTGADIECGSYGFRATGQVLKFDGYLAAWGEGPGRPALARGGGSGDGDSGDVVPDTDSGADSGTDAAPDQPDGTGGPTDGAPDGVPGRGRGASPDGEGDLLPPLEEGETLIPERIVPAQHFTQPPSRYNDATLVKELESRGIGRPSTYAATISVLRDKAYAEGQRGQLRPTEMGFMVNELLVGSFPRLLDYDFTADLEEDLDQIEEGQAERLSVLQKLYSPLAESLDTARESMLNVKLDGLPVDTPCPRCGESGGMRIRYGKSGFYLSCTGCGGTCDFTRDERGAPVPQPDPELEGEIDCPECGKPMVVKKGRFGPFLACSGYPDCRTTRPVKVEDGRAIPLDHEEAPDFPEGVPRECPKCGSPMVVKRARKGSWFMGCASYPKCRETRPFPTDFRCPSEGCDGQLVERNSVRGPFMGCSRYPKCTFLARGELVKDPCPVCGFPYRIRKISKGGVPGPLRCPSTACPTCEKPPRSAREPRKASGPEAADVKGAELPKDAEAPPRKPSRAAAGKDPAPAGGKAAKPRATSDAAPAKAGKPVGARARESEQAKRNRAAGYLKASATRRARNANAKAAGEAGGEAGPSAPSPGISGSGAPDDAGS